MTSPERAACVVLDGAGSLLVVRRLRDGRRYCVLPGGGVEPGEDPEAAAVRELAEETGLRGRVDRHLATLDHPDRRAHYLLVGVEGTGRRAVSPAEDSPELVRQTDGDRHAPAWISLSSLDAEDLQPVAARDLVLQAARAAGPGSVLRPLRLEDLDDVVAVQEEGSVAALSHLFPQDTHPFPREAVRERWQQELAGDRVDCFVVGREGRVEGFAAVTGDELLHFGTALRTWGSGLARQAHDELVDRLRDRGRRGARLWVFEENHHARHFYEHRGWAPDGRRTTSAFAPNPVLVGYARDLGPRTAPPAD